MGTFLDYLEETREFYTAFLETVSRFGSLKADNKYKSDRFFVSAEQMFDKFSPFKKGDRVELVKAFCTDNPRHGWYGAQHFLIEGAIATVYSVDWSTNIKDFVYGLMFENESYKHFQTGELIPVERKCVYFFPSHYLSEASDRP